MASFGEELRRHREVRSISLREIADATKINIRFLEALETNDFKHLPGGQFNKGFIRAYSRHLGVDGEGMVDAYLMEMKVQDEADRALGKASAPNRGSFVTGRVIAGLAALLLLGAVAAGIAALWLHFKGKRSTVSEAPALHATTASSSEVASAPDNGKAAALPPARDTPQQAGGGSETAGGSVEPASVRGTGAGLTPSGGAQPASSDVAPAAAPIEGLPQGALTLFITPLGRTKLKLACNSKETYAGVIEPGRSLTQKCEGVFEVSIDDAGAANFFLNGERVYLGRPRQAVAGRHISAANYVEFTQPPGGGATK